jgi:hypothetical protein
MSPEENLKKSDEVTLSAYASNRVWPQQKAPVDLRQD